MRENYKWLLILAAVCIVVFANSIGGEFVYDDLRQIVRNPLIQENSLFWKALTSDVWAFKGDGSVAASNYWRPTFTLWNIIGFRLFAFEPGGWHVLNMLLHIGVTLMAFMLLVRWNLGTAVAFVAALIFAVHPIHVESVSWIAGSPDLLFSLAFLGSLWFATGWQSSRSIRDLILAVMLYAVALGSKEIGIFCIPIYALLPRADDDDSAPLELINPLLIAIAITAVVYFGLRWVVLGAISYPPDDAVGTFDALMSVPSMFAFYLRQIFAPVSLAVNYPLTPAANVGLMNFFLPLIVSIIALAATIFLARKTRIAILGAALFLLPLIPAMNATAFISEQLVHDRYLYLPLLGVLIMLVPLAARSLGDRTLIIVGAVIAVVLSIQTFRYNTAWANDLALWSWTAGVDDSAFTSMQHASAVAAAGRVADSIPIYSKAIERRPSPRAYLGRGRAYVETKRYPEAERDLQTALSMPDERQEAYGLYQTYEALGIAYLEQNKNEAAIQNFSKGRSDLPIYAAALTEKLAVAQYQAGQKEAALRELEAAQQQARQELLPESKNVFLRLGMLYAEQGRKEEAKAALREFLALTATSGDKSVLAARSQASKMLERMK